MIPKHARISAVVFYNNACRVYSLLVEEVQLLFKLIKFAPPFPMQGEFIYMGFLLAFIITFDGLSFFICSNFAVVKSFLPFLCTCNNNDIRICIQALMLSLTLIYLQLMHMAE